MPYRISIDNVPYRMDIEEIDGQKQKFLIRYQDQELIVEAFSSSLSHYTLLVENHSYDVFVSNGKSPPMVFVNGQYFELAYERSAEGPHRGRGKRRTVKGPYDCKALMPGKIVKILVKEGEKVKAKQPLLVLEAMKMENEILAPHEGQVKTVHVKTGQSVENGQKLVTVQIV